MSSMKLSQEIGSLLHLRAVDDDDQNFLYQLYATTRTEEMAMVPWDDVEKQAFLQQQFNAQSHHYRKHFSSASFDIIEKDSKEGRSAIGRLYVDRRKDEIRIIDIAILPQYRGQGIGSHYLKTLIDEASQAGQCVAIHVEHNNPALNLYQQLGFEHVHDEGVYRFMRYCP